MGPGVWDHALMKRAAITGPERRAEEFRPSTVATPFRALRVWLLALFPIHRRLRLGFTLWILGAAMGGRLAAAQGAALIPPPAFSVVEGAHAKPFIVELQVSSAGKGMEIRYTDDGSEPTETSALYRQPLRVTRSICLKARAFAPDLGRSPVSSQVYTVLAEDFQPFRSSLPLVVIQTQGQPIAHRTKARVAFQIYEPIGGTASLTTRATWQGDLEISLRGNTSLRFPKNSYTLKFLDAQGEGLKIPAAGMPEDSDWVLYAPYFDRTQLRDVLAYDLSNRIGRYAPRTRFVEVFVMDAAGRMTQSDYAGVYVLEEKIKRGRHRVSFLAPGSTNAPTAPQDGYLFKMDHIDPGEKGFWTARGLHFLHVHPKERDIRAEQSAWLTQHLNQFESALFGPRFADPGEGYARFLDVDAFIDHFWLVEMSKNVDGFRFSAYLQWSPGGKLKMGPIWDWDQSYGNANFFGGESPEGWYWPFIRDSEINWFARLIQDPAFQKKVKGRWLELRRGPFETAQVLRRIDALVVDLGDAQKRNSNRWPTRRNYPDYVLQMKRWIQARLEWIDRELPTVSEP